MAGKAYFLNESDKESIERLIEHVGQTLKVRRPQTRPNDDLSSGSGVYVAKTPPGGILAMSGSNPGGTLCQIYQVIPNATEGTGTGTAGSTHPVSLSGATLDLIGIQEYVLNVRPSSIDGDTWILVSKERFGSWMAIFMPEDPLDPWYLSVSNEDEVFYPVGDIVFDDVDFTVVDQTEGTGSGGPPSAMTVIVNTSGFSGSILNITDVGIELDTETCLIDVTLTTEEIIVLNGLVKSVGE